MANTIRTQVAIVGAGPAGLFLAHSLHRNGIDVVVIEARTADHVLSRIRAGVLETVTTDLLEELGMDARLRRERMDHEGLTIVSSRGDPIAIPVKALTGRGVTVYGQTEITRDLIEGAATRGISVLWECEQVSLHDVRGSSPRVRFIRHGVHHEVACDYIAGCDGFHGISRQVAARQSGCRHFERVYPFGWLGVLADVPPCHHEVVYASHDQGFALASMRSPTRSRYYIQVPVEEEIAAWPDERFWDEVSLRLGSSFASKIQRGPSIEKSIAPLRSFVFEPMRVGRLMLAGDAAHIVPPTGAKGLNLAASDIVYLAEAIIAACRDGSDTALDRYSERALARVWKTERFSWYLTTLLHRFPHASPFDARMQDAELDYLARSEALQHSLAEQYVGLPL